MANANEHGSIAAADAAGKAEEIKSRRAERKQGTEAQRAKWREKKRKQRQPSSAAAAGTSDDRPPYVPNEASIQLCTVLTISVWSLVQVFTGRRALTEGEAASVGAALDPVVYKYVPSLTEWMPEIGLVVAVFAVWNATEPPEESSNGPVGSNESRASGDATSPGAHVGLPKGMAKRVADALSEVQPGDLAPGKNVP